MSGEMFALLPDRALVLVTGEEAGTFLHNLLTNDIEELPPGKARHAALLTPQGKILFDMLVGRLDAGFGLDVSRQSMPDLVKRLRFYKLRAKVTITDASATHRIGALWGGSPPLAPREVVLADARHPDLGARLWLAQGAMPPSGASEASAESYHAHRIGLGVPEGGKDFPLGDTFPHEADMDLLNGLDFKKGCYVGQEVVSRMQHRGTARKRVVPVAADGPLPSPGSDITAGPASIGKLGSVAGRLGLAMLRLDRAEEAVAKGEPMLASSVPIRLRAADWLPFKLPGAPT